MFSLEND